MARVEEADIPQESFLKRYELLGCHVDCYAADVKGTPDLARFITVFFDSWIFRLERKLIAVMGRGSTNAADVQALALGERQTFAVWTVEDRSANEIILAFDQPRGRSWLHVSDAGDQSGRTRLRFGSTLLPVGQDKDGAPKMDGLMKALLPAHLFYARLLLRAAVADWERGKADNPADMP